MTGIRRAQLAGMNQHYKKFSLEYFLDSQQRAGFQSIELWYGAPHFWIDSAGVEDCGPIRRRCAERGLRVVSVTIPSCSYQYQYASQSGYHQARSLRYFTNGIHAAVELDCRIMTINSGWGYLCDRQSDAWKRSRDTISALCEVARREGVTLAMESLREDESNLVNSLAAAKRMFDEIRHPALKVMADTIATGAAGETLEDWFRVFGKDLVHLHFLDGDPYVHSVWGDGNDPLEKQLRVLSAQGYTGYLVQEVADERYFDDPAAADLLNMRVLERFVQD